MPDNRVTLTMKLDPRLMDRIDHNARKEGLSRSGYVLQWLPEYYCDWREGETAADRTRRVKGLPAV